MYAHRLTQVKPSLQNGSLNANSDNGNDTDFVSRSGALVSELHLQKDALCSCTSYICVLEVQTVCGLSTLLLQRECIVHGNDCTQVG